MLEVIIAEDLDWEHMFYQKQVALHEHLTSFAIESIANISQTPLKWDLTTKNTIY